MRVKAAKGSEPADFEQVNREQGYIEGVLMHVSFAFPVNLHHPSQLPDVIACKMISTLG